MDSSSTFLSLNSCFTYFQQCWIFSAASSRLGRCFFVGRRVLKSSSRRSYKLLKLICFVNYSCTFLCCFAIYPSWHLNSQSQSYCSLNSLFFYAVSYGTSNIDRQSIWTPDEDFALSWHSWTILWYTRQKQRPFCKECGRQVCLRWRVAYLFLGLFCLSLKCPRFWWLQIFLFHLGHNFDCLYWNISLMAFHNFRPPISLQKHLSYSALFLFSSHFDYFFTTSWLCRLRHWLPINLKDSDLSNLSLFSRLLNPQHLQSYCPFQYTMN